MKACKTCQFWPSDGYPLLDGHHLDCPEIALPPLTPEERAAVEGLPKDFIQRLLRGERPVTDPGTFAN